MGTTSVECAGCRVLGYEYHNSFLYFKYMYVISVSPKHPEKVMVSMRDQIYDKTEHRDPKRPEFRGTKRL